MLALVVDNRYAIQVFMWSRDSKNRQKIVTLLLYTLRWADIDKRPCLIGGKDASQQSQCVPGVQLCADFNTGAKNVKIGLIRYIV